MSLQEQQGRIINSKEGEKEDRSKGEFGIQEDFNRVGKLMSRIS
jgi:hypothetical protein